MFTEAKLSYTNFNFIYVFSYRTLTFSFFFVLTYFVCISLFSCLRLITRTDMNNDVSETFPADLDVCVSVVALYCSSSLCVQEVLYFPDGPLFFL